MCHSSSDIRFDEEETSQKQEPSVRAPLPSQRDSLENSSSSSHYVVRPNPRQTSRVDDQGSMNIRH